MIEMLDRSAPAPEPARHWPVSREGTPRVPVPALQAELRAAMADEVDYAMVLVSCDMQLVHANRAARRGLEDGVAYSDACGELHVRCRVDQAGLAAAVHAACSRGLRGYVQLSGPQGASAAVAVVPQRGRNGTDAALLTFSRAQVCESLSLNAFARHHGLTAGETRVLEAVCSGHSAAAIARRHGVAVTTVRTQLTSLRAKTSAKTVNDLLRTMALLPPMVNVLQRGQLHTS
ncbi:MAG: hypothetical protein RLZZ618_4270 [Pseudomonadota bacterium]